MCIADGVAKYFISVQQINVRKPVRKSTPVNLKLENFLFQRFILLTLIIHNPPPHKYLYTYTLIATQSAARYFPVSIGFSVWNEFFV